MKTLMLASLLLLLAIGCEQKPKQDLRAPFIQCDVRDGEDHWRETVASFNTHVSFDFYVSTPQKIVVRCETKTGKGVIDENPDAR